MKILITHMLIVLASCLLGQTGDINYPISGKNYALDTVKIQGFYITEYKKSDLKKQLRIKKKERKGKHVRMIPIDFSKYNYFIPRQWVQNVNLGEIRTILFNKDSLFLPCGEYGEFMVKFFNKHNLTTKDVCKMPSFEDQVKNIRRFEFKKKVFDIYEIQAIWLKVVADPIDVEALYGEGCHNYDKDSIVLFVYFGYDLIDDVKCLNEKYKEIPYDVGSSDDLPDVTQ